MIQYLRDTNSTVGYDTIDQVHKQYSRIQYNRSGTQTVQQDMMQQIRDINSTVGYNTIDQVHNSTVGHDTIDEGHKQYSRIQYNRLGT